MFAVIDATYSAAGGIAICEPVIVRQIGSRAIVLVFAAGGDDTCTVPVREQTGSRAIVRDTQEILDGKADYPNARR